MGAASNKFNNATNLTIQNGTLNLDGVVCNANGIIILDERGTQVTTLTLNNVDVEGKDYNSAFAVFYIGRTSILNIIGGSVTLENELFSAGGVFKADSSEGKLTVDGTTTLNGTSVVTVKDIGEAVLAFREDCAMTPILTLEDTAVLLLDEKIVNTVKGEVAVADTADLCEAHAITEVKANDSTCTETGNIAHFICEACERVYSDAEGETEITVEDTIVKMKDHPYGDGVQTTAPTCDKTGILPYTCTAKDCGHTKTETIPATGALSVAPVMALLVINSIGAGALIIGKKRFF